MPSLPDRHSFIHAPSSPTTHQSINPLLLPAPACTCTCTCTCAWTFTAPSSTCTCACTCTCNLHLPSTFHLSSFVPSFFPGSHPRTLYPSSSFSPPRLNFILHLPSPSSTQFILPVTVFFCFSRYIFFLIVRPVATFRPTTTTPTLANNLHTRPSRDPLYRGFDYLHDNSCTNWPRTWISHLQPRSIQFSRSPAQIFCIDSLQTVEYRRQLL